MKNFIKLLKYAYKWYNLNLQKEIRNLEAKGVFISIDHEHYDDGSNCAWSLDFRKNLPEGKKLGDCKTGSFGDNHEFGDTIGCYIAAITLANFLLEDDNLKWYFFNIKETVTPEGHADAMKTYEVRRHAHSLIYV